MLSIYNVICAAIIKTITRYEDAQGYPCYRG